MEPDTLPAPEFVQMPELGLQLTHIWPQNPDLAVLLAQCSIQRRHRAILPSLAKTSLSQDRPQHAKLWFLVVSQKGRKCHSGPGSERETPLPDSLGAREGKGRDGGLWGAWGRGGGGGTTKFPRNKHEPKMSPK